MLRLVTGTLCSALVLCVAATAPAQVRLQQKYVEGSTQRLDVEVEVEQTLTLAGMDLETSSTSFIETTNNVGQRQTDGTLEVTQKVTKIQNNSSYPGGVSLSFDSDDPDKQADIPQLEMVLDLFRATLEMTTTRTVDADNRTQSVEATPEIVQNLNELFHEQFNPATLKQAAVQEENRLPREPVSIGDVWTRTEIFQATGSFLTFQREFEYKGTVERDGKTLDRIVGTAKTVSLQQDSNTQTPLQITDSDLKVESGQTEILFDREAGTVVSGEESFHVTGDLKASANGMEFDGSLDLTVKSKSTLKQ